MTTVHLVRHAAHGLLGAVLAGRMGGVALSVEGQAQAAGLAKNLAAFPMAAVISSPVQRAVETATAIAAPFDLPVVMDDAFQEIDFGRWTGMTFTDLDSAPGWHGWNAARGLAPTPGGETMLAAQARAVGAVFGLRDRYPGQAVAVVSHSDIIKAILAHTLGMPLDLIHRIEVAPASVSVLELGPAHAVVHGINQR